MSRQAQRAQWMALVMVAAVGSLAACGDDSDPTPDAHPRDIVGVQLGVSLGSQLVRDDGVVVSWGYSEEGARGFPMPLFDPLDPPPIPAPAEIDLGGEPVVAVAAGRAHSCALFDDGRLKCWGWNMFGQLGLGDTEDRGDALGEMGDALPYVDLGEGRRATAVTLMPGSTCALLDDGAVKCWGGNSVGQLGLGDVEQRGDEPGEMGDALPAVDLGTGRTAVEIDGGGGFVCALLDDTNVKCWGANEPLVEQLGGLSTGHRGDEPGEMGDAMPNVDLGHDVRVASVSCGDQHSCVVTELGAVKCWGLNSEGWCPDSAGPDSGPCFDNPNTAGRLGYGDVYGRPHYASFPDPEGVGMGDLLPDVDLGTGVKALAVEAGIEHTCALTSDRRVKCWGSGTRNRLGGGVSQDIGDEPGEMGDALPYVDLGIDRTVQVLSSHFSNTCVLLDDGAVKCWGGDYPTEMGDALPAIDLPE